MTHLCTFVLMTKLCCNSLLLKTEILKLFYSEIVFFFFSQTSNFSVFSIFDYELTFHVSVASLTRFLNPIISEQKNALLWHLTDTSFIYAIMSHRSLIFGHFFFLKMSFYILLLFLDFVLMILTYYNICWYLWFTVCRMTTLFIFFYFFLVTGFLIKALESPLVVWFIYFVYMRHLKYSWLAEEVETLCAVNLTKTLKSTLI